MATEAGEKTSNDLAKEVLALSRRNDKLTKLVEKLNAEIQEKAAKIKELSEKAEAGSDVLARAQQEIQETDARHSDELDSILDAVKSLGKTIREGKPC